MRAYEPGSTQESCEPKVKNRVLKVKNMKQRNSPQQRSPTATEQEIKLVKGRALMPLHAEQRRSGEASELLFKLSHDLSYQVAAPSDEFVLLLAKGLTGARDVTIPISGSNRRWVDPTKGIKDSQRRVVATLFRTTAVFTDGCLVARTDIQPTNLVIRDILDGIPAYMSTKALAAVACVVVDCNAAEIPLRTGEMDLKEYERLFLSAMLPLGRLFDRSFDLVVKRTAYELTDAAIRGLQREDTRGKHG
jgi:hypothetical protein